MKKSYTLRLEIDMITDVQTLAKKSSRNVNKEFEYLIQQSINNSKNIIQIDINKIQSLGITCQTEEDIINLIKK
jgi:hypothetical protein